MARTALEDPAHRIIPGSGGLGDADGALTYFMVASGGVLRDMGMAGPTSAQASQMEAEGHKVEAATRYFGVRPHAQISDLRCSLHFLLH